jgi:peptide/nickel transport system substrate-binding protein
MRTLARVGAVVTALWLTGAAPGGTVRIALREQPNTLNPLLATQFDENYVCEGIFSGLTVLDDRGRLQPELAEAVPTRANGGISADGKQLVYRLRRNARWQDGVAVTADDVVAVTADDVVFTFGKMRDPKVPFPSLTLYDVVERVEARDPHTVVVRLKRPAPDAPAEIFVNGQNGAILPKHVLEHVADLAHAAFNGAPIGSGPYRVERWERGSSLRLVANRDYFGGAPSVERIDFTFLPDSNTRAFAVESQGADLAQIVAVNIPAVRAAGVRVLSVVQPTLVYLLYRVDAPPFDDVLVRRALSRAVDPGEIARKVYLGEAAPATDLLPPQSQYHATRAAARANLREAASLLQSAGWRAGADGIRVRGGSRLTVTLTTIAGNASLQRAAVLLQAAWKTIGVEATVRPLQTSLLFAPGGTLPSGDFTVALVNFSFPITPDRTELLASRAVAPAGFNNGRYRDAELDRLFAAAHTEIDVTKRKALFAQIDRRVTVNVPVFPIVWTKAVFAISPRVAGIRPEPVNSDLWNVATWRVR